MTKGPLLIINDYRICQAVTGNMESFNRSGEGWEREEGRSRTKKKPMF